MSRIINRRIIYIDIWVASFWLKKEIDMENKNLSKSSFKVLFIGNSFADDTIEYAYSIAKDIGMENILIGNLYYGGCTLEEHLSFLNDTNPHYNFRMARSEKIIHSAEGDTPDTFIEEGVIYTDWDYIIFQQGSRDSGIPFKYDNLPILIDYVKKLASNPNVIFGFNMTWAYASNSKNGGFSSYSFNQEVMYKGILESIRTKVLPNKGIKFVIPNGTAIQNARTSFIGDNLTRDEADHLSLDLGRYIAGLTFIATLTKVDVDKIKFAPAGLDKKKMLLAKESVKNAINNPFEVTRSRYID